MVIKADKMGKLFSRVGRRKRDSYELVRQLNVVANANDEFIVWCKCKVCAPNDSARADTRERKSSTPCIYELYNLKKPKFTHVSNEQFAQHIRQLMPALNRKFRHLCGIIKRESLMNVS